MAFINSLPGAVAQGIIWGIMAIGLFVSFRILDFADLTVDGTLATGASIFVMCATNGMSIPLSMFLAFIGGCLAGFLTGIFHCYFGIPPILAGILTQLALYSINLNILGKANVAINVSKYPLWVSLRFINQSLIVSSVITVILIAILFWFFGTELGDSIRATGNNQAMARANGINTNYTKIWALSISNGLVGLSGAMLCQYQGYADINMGRGAIVIGLAAVIIGEVLFGKFFKTFYLRLLGAVCGAIIYYIVITLVLSLGFPSNDLKLFSAVVVAIFLGVPFWQKNFRSTHVKSAGGEK